MKDLKLKNQKTFFLFSLIFFTTTLAHAYTDYEEVGFDQLVRELSSTSTTYRSNYNPNSLATVKMHAGLGYVTSLISVIDTYDVPIPDEYIQDDKGKIDGSTFEGGIAGKMYRQATQPATDTFDSSSKGIQLSYGIDLFSRNWKAEGSIRNFDPVETPERTIYFQEFDLKIVYHNWMSRGFKMRGGAGLTARYLDIWHKRYQKKYEYSTPSSIIFLGGSTYISQGVSFGADISRRSTFVGETADRAAFDLTLRLDSHF